MAGYFAAQWQTRRLTWRTLEPTHVSQIMAPNHQHWSLTQWGHYVIISCHNNNSECSVGVNSEKTLSLFCLKQYQLFGKTPHICHVLFWTFSNFLKPKAKKIWSHLGLQQLKENFLLNYGLLSNLMAPKYSVSHRSSQLNISITTSYTTTME